MRILFITNYYPPSDQGWGYMQLCEEVVDGLAARGHETAVLTSSNCDGLEIARTYPVYRLLTIEPDWHIEQSAAQQFFVGRRRRESEAVDHLRKLLERFKPQGIFIWHAVGLPRVLLRAAEQLVPTVYYLAGYLPELPDEYIAYWQAQPVSGAARLFKRPLAKLALAMLRYEGKPVPLKYEHVICVSGYVRQRLVEQHMIPPASIVIHNGINVDLFSTSRPLRTFDGKLMLLCAGRLEPEKGVHHVIEAIGSLSREQRDRIGLLAIVGDGQPAYLAHLRSLVGKLDLSELVRFAPPVLRDDMPKLLHMYDVLIQPSALEALSRMMQEAMAAGLLVIGTNTGGSGELLTHQKTGLVFNAGDAGSLCRQLARVLEEPGLATNLAAAGRASVYEAFRIDQTVTKIEAYLQGVVV